VARSKDYIKQFFPRVSTGRIPLEAIRVCGGNIYRAIILCQLLFWAGKGKCRGSNQGLFYKSYADLEIETTINQRTIKRACAWMKAQGFLETKVKKVKGVRTTHWRLDFIKFRVFMKESQTNEDSNGL